MENSTLEKFRMLVEELHPDMAEKLLNDAMDNTVTPEVYKAQLQGMTSTTPTEKQGREEKELHQPDRFNHYRLMNHTGMINLYLQKFPNGMTFKLDGIGAEQLYNLVNKGYMNDRQSFHSVVGDNTPSKDGLQVSFRLAPQNYHILWPAEQKYDNDKLMEWLDQKGYSKMDANIMESIHQHPDGTGIEMYFIEDNLYPSMTIEGQSLDKVQAVCLQFPNLKDDELKELLLNDNLLEEKLQQQKPDDGVSLMCIHENMNGVIFYEPGNLGFVKADAARKIDLWGEKLSASSMERIDHIVHHRNVVADIYGTGQLKAMFRTPPEDGEKTDVWMNTKTGTIQKFEEIKNWDGTDYLEKMNGYVIRKDALNDWVNLSGRITDMKVLSKPVPSLRCKVDGVQQMAFPLTHDEWLWVERSKRMGYDKKTCQNFLIEMAAEKHKTLLMSGQEENRGLKI